MKLYQMVRELVSSGVKFTIGPLLSFKNYGNIVRKLIGMFFEQLVDQMTVAILPLCIVEFDDQSLPFCRTKQV